MVTFSELRCLSLNSKILFYFHSYDSITHYMTVTGSWVAITPRWWMCLWLRGLWLLCDPICSWSSRGTGFCDKIATFRAGCSNPTSDSSMIFAILFLVVESKPRLGSGKLLKKPWLMTLDSDNLIIRQRCSTLVGPFLMIHSGLSMAPRLQGFDWQEGCCHLSNNSYNNQYDGKKRLGQLFSPVIPQG